MNRTIAIFLLLCACQPSSRQEQQFPSERNSTKKMRLIPEGKLLMGVEKGFGDEQPVHEVPIEAFYMDETPVTYEDFALYVADGGLAPAYWNYDTYNKPQQPVSGISWYHAADYCNWRSLREGLQPAYRPTDALDAWGHPQWVAAPQANGYRLPSEAQFEYAARGGLVGKDFPWGDEFSDEWANYDTEKGFMVGEWWRLADVKSQRPNNYGLYNVCGNVWQWCDDWYGQYGTQVPSSQVRPSDAARVKCVRGGGWGSVSPDYLKVHKRSYNVPSNHTFDIGFRCVLPANAQPDSARIGMHAFYAPPKIWDAEDGGIFEGKPLAIDSDTFLLKLASFLGEHYPHSIYFQQTVDGQEVTTPQALAKQIIEGAKAYNIHPLFVAAVMCTETGLGTCSFSRWFNNPMAYHWQNRLMEAGAPVYEDLPNARNRKFKTLKHAIEAMGKGIRRSFYLPKARADLYEYHLLYVGYEAQEWIGTLSRVYWQVGGIRFEAHYPASNCGQFIYLDWETLRHQ